MIGYAIFETAIGWAGIAWGDRGLVGVRLPAREAEATRRGFERRFPGAVEREPPAELARVIDGVRALLRGEKADLSDAPLDPPPGWSPASLIRKIDAGAQFVQTQFCMDAGVAGRYLARLSSEGLIDRVRYLIGVAPLASARSARWILDHLPGSIIPDALIARLEDARDPRAEGRRACLELIEQLAETAGVSGVHVMGPLNEAAVPEVLADARHLRARTAI